MKNSVLTHVHASRVESHGSAAGRTRLPPVGECHKTPPVTLPSPLRDAAEDSFILSTAGRSSVLHNLEGQPALFEAPPQAIYCKAPIKAQLYKGTRPGANERGLRQDF